MAAQTPSPSVWLITGCSGGIGLHIAEIALAAGHKVVATSRNPTKTPSVVQSFESRGGAWATIDVTSPDDILAAQVDTATKIYGHIDVLVNNAGITVAGAVEDVPMHKVRTVFETNLFGPWRLVKLLLPQMRERQLGTIVAVSSLLGFITSPVASNYCAAKHALVAFSECLAGDVAAFGIRVIIAEPGGVRTEFINKNVPSTVSTPYEGTLTETVLKTAVKQAGQEIGNPAKVALRIVEAVDGTGLAGEVIQKMALAPEVAIRLPMGSDSGIMMGVKGKTLSQLAAETEELWKSTDFEDAKESMWVSGK